MVLAPYGVLQSLLGDRDLEPTERGFLTALSTALGTPVTTLADATRALAGDARVLRTIDTHEQLRRLDTWLRQRFVPALPQNARRLRAGRDTPSAWQRDLGDLLRSIRLDNLSDEAARTWVFPGQAGEGRQRLIAGKQRSERTEIKVEYAGAKHEVHPAFDHPVLQGRQGESDVSLLCTPDGADDQLCVDRGGRRIGEKEWGFRYIPLDWV